MLWIKHSGLKKVSVKYADAVRQQEGTKIHLAVKKNSHMVTSLIRPEARPRYVST